MSKIKSFNDQNLCAATLVLKILSFDIGICFEFRYSDFEFHI